MVSDGTAPIRRALIRRTVVDVLNAGGSVTPASVDAAAGLPAGAFGEIYPSVEAVYADLVADLVGAHAHDVAALPSMRRRSARQSIALSLGGFWDTVVRYLDEHRAVQIIRMIEPDLPVVGPTGADVPLHRLPVFWAQRWLVDVGAVQGIIWLKPVPLLAQLVVATMDGLLVDQLHHRNTVGVRRLLDVFAYQLAQLGTRDVRSRTTPSALPTSDVLPGQAPPVD